MLIIFVSNGDENGGMSFKYNDGRYISSTISFFSITFLFILVPFFIIKLKSSNELKSMVNLGLERKKYFFITLFLSFLLIYLSMMLFFLLPLNLIFIFMRNEGYPPEGIESNFEIFKKAKWGILFIYLIINGMFSICFGYVIGMKLKSKQILYFFHFLFIVILFIYSTMFLMQFSFSKPYEEVEEFWFAIHTLPLLIPLFPIYLAPPLIYDFTYVGDIKRNIDSMYLIYGVGIIEMVIITTISILIKEKVFSFSIKR